MKVAIAYLTKDRVDLTKQTMAALIQPDKFRTYWIDGSNTPEGKAIAEESYASLRHKLITDIRGGADAAIVFAIDWLLDEGADYIGLCENDVLLAPDWFERTMALFERGAGEGLVVGAASARAYDDRILVQRDSYAVMHNLGAGHVIYTRQAAELILANYRSAWWPDNRAIFAQLSGVDIGRYAAFRGAVQWCTADWGFDAILAQHGLASVALVPSAVEMIGQDPPLEAQGLRLVDAPVEELKNDEAFDRFRCALEMVRSGRTAMQTITPIHRASMNGGASLIFPHQISYPVWTGDWRLKWSQGFGPFSWRAGEKDCGLRVGVFGPSVFLVSGGDRAAKVTIRDTESGYEIEPEVPPAAHGITQLPVPGHVSYREIEMIAGEGLVFYGIQTQEPQPLSDRKFDYSVLPPV